MMKRFFAFAPFALGLLSCGGGPLAASTFVGDVEGTDIRVGLVTEGGKVAMFFCGGATTYTNSTHWFRGTAEPALLEFAADGWVAKGGVERDVASGTVDRGNGTVLRWKANKVSEGGLPGLYELKEDGVGTSGVIVIDEKNAQGALIPINPGRNVEQIEAILPVARQNDGVVVRILEATPRQVTVTRVRAK